MTSVRFCYQWFALQGVAHGPHGATEASDWLPQLGDWTPEIENNCMLHPQDSDWVLDIPITGTATLTIEMQNNRDDPRDAKLIVSQLFGESSETERRVHPGEIVRMSATVDVDGGDRVRALVSNVAGEWLLIDSDWRIQGKSQ